VESMSELTSGRPAQTVATSPPPALSGDGWRSGEGASAPELDVLVIGAGQAGLAMAHRLRSTGLRYEVVDGHSGVGDSWRQRYDSLVLFTPRSYSALPGLAVAGDPDGYPTKDEIADYLESYAAHFALPIRLNAEVRSLDQVDGRFRAMTGEDVGIEARAVVIASGAFQVPRIPALAAALSSQVYQLTAASYRGPSQVPAGSVLVAGDGATGRQIALELAASHEVMLATGRSRQVTPERIFRRSIFWWLDHLGVLRATRDSRIGRRMMAGDPFPGRGLALSRLRNAGVAVVPRLAAADGKTVRFVDGGAADIGAVVWATGYRDDSEWVGMRAAKNSDGGFAESRGVSPVPGLYFVGRSWQWTRGSALLTGVDADAAYVAAQISRTLADRPASSERG
jgi:putative flavoprotein involved in K+ transport